jgi:hypothetical protein
MIDQGTKRNLHDWIRRQVFTHGEDPKNGRCTGFLVLHMGSGKNNQVASVPVHEKFGPEDVEEMATELVNMAEFDADALGGIQKYYLTASFENLSAPINRFAFRVNGAASEDNVDTFDSEPANTKGLLGQMMRHTEASHRISVASTGHVITMQNKIITRQAEQLEAMQSKHIELIETLEELKSERHSRDLDAAESMRKQEAYKDITQKILMLMPIVVNKFTGKKLLPEKTTSGEQMVKSLMDSIKPEQMEKMGEILTPEQQMIIFNVYENMRKFDSEEENKNANPSNGHAS